jgi:hypothetical protein
VSDSVNPTLGKIEDLSKTLVWDPLVDAELAVIFAHAPVLALWPFKQILTILTHTFSDQLYSGLRTFIDVEALPFINDSHRKAFDSAEVTLKIIAHDKGPASPEYRNAREEAKNALARFVRFNG